MPINFFGFTIGRSGSNDPAPTVPTTDTPLQSERPEHDGELGAVGTVSYGGFLDGEEYNAELRGQKAIEVYTKMRADGMVRGILRVLTLPLREATLQCTAASDDDIDAEIAEATEWALQNMEGQDYDDFVRQAVDGGVTYGHAVFEPVWVKPDKTPNIVEHNGTMILAPFKMAPRLQKTLYRWIIDEVGELLSIQQRTFVPALPADTAAPIGDSNGSSFALGVSGTYKFIDLPADRLQVFSFDRIGANFLGESVLRSAWKHFYFKDNILRIMAVGIERHLVGVPYAIGRQGISPIEQTSLIAALRTLRSHEKAYLYVNEAQLATQATVGMPPLGFLDMPNLGSNGRLADLAIQYHDRQMAISVVADFLSLGSGLGGNSNVMSRDKTSYFFLALQGYGKNYTGALRKQFVRRFVDLNWPGHGRYPEVRLMGLEAKDVGQFARGIAQIISVGGITADAEVENQLRDIFGLPLLPEDAQGNPVRPDPPAPTPADPNADPAADPAKPDRTISLSERMVRLAESIGTSNADDLQKHVASQMKENALRLLTASSDDGTDTQADDYDSHDFVDDAVKLLAAAFLSAYLLGLALQTTTRAGGGGGALPSAGAGAAAEAWAQEATNAQRGYLDGFANDITSGALSESQVAARAESYAAPVWTGFQRGRVEGTPPEMKIRWHTEGDGVCPLCKPRDGVLYISSTLPGFPGEGTFGELCEGGPNCRCWLEVITVDRGGG